ncbi:MAG: V-type ATP synthase subunit I [Bacteroidales bacterium]|nr:MAG: V-type ATP synthase subunit I [Bacteroidales bacterium]
MKRYSFLVYHREYTDFLNELQKIGILHVIEKESGELADEKLREQYNLINQFNTAIKFLLKREVEAKSKSIAKSDGHKILGEIQNIQEEIELKTQQLSSLKKEISIIKPWGDFSFEDMDRLRDHGFNIRFYICPAKKFDNKWKAEYNVEEINHIGGQTYFIVVQEGDESIDINAEEIKLPETSLSGLLKKQKDIEDVLEKSEEIFDLYAQKYISLLISTRDKLQEQFDFENVVFNTEKQAEEKLMLMEGWVPEDKMEEINLFLENSGIYYIASNPEPGDKIPVKLKNNKYSKLFEPIAELYSLPDYKELDLTPFFAPFFMMFFGFCLGDAGYGLLFIIIASIIKLRAKRSIKPLITLVQILGGSTIVFGLLSGTIFGIDLKLVNIPFLTSMKDIFLDPKDMFYFALILGGIQIIFGMIVKILNITKQLGFKYALSTLGWIILIVSSVLYYMLKSKYGTEVNGLKYLYFVVLVSSLIMILFLNNPEKGLLGNLGKGLGDIYFTATGVFGDLLSYIRLFALGISSAILGYVFNYLALEMRGDTIIVSQIVFLLILIVGHSLNIFMAVLGAFVHPLRLTFVEFYKNAGFIGGGKEYKPFKKNK